MKDYDIVYCCSDYYAPHLGASLVSILENISVKNRVHFHILDFDISTHNKAKLRSIITKYNALNHIFLYDSVDFSENNPALASETEQSKQTAPLLRDSAVAESNQSIKSANWGGAVKIVPTQKIANLNTHSHFTNRI